MGEFGDKFRNAREKKELSLDDVSNVTKISARMLKAIEQEDFEQLPGGVFNKGFIRAYAKHLGLDGEEAVTDYLASLRQAQIAAHEVWEPQAPAPTRTPAAAKVRVAEPKKPAATSEGPVKIEELPDLQLPRVEDIRPPRKNFGGKPGGEVPWKLIAASVVVLALGLFLWARHNRTIHAAAEPQTQVVNAQAAPPVPSPQASTPAPQSSPPAHSDTTTTKVTAATKASTSADPAPQTPSVPETHPIKPPIPAADSVETSDVTVRTFGKPSAQPSEKAGTLTLVIRATENSWISVLADGQLTTQETLIAPAHTSVHATREITVRIGNAAGVSFLFNGTEIPAQGAEAEVRTFTFDSTGMKTTAVPPTN
jgi:cytoskeleton protein RodZ